VTRRDVTETPPGHGAGTEAEDEYPPILPGRGASDYERYLRTDELLSLQKTPEHMSPWEYTLGVRPLLGHGSGFDSPGWNALRRVSPDLGAAFHEVRREAGLSLLEVYTRGREHEELYQLAELLTEWDERATLWRVHHYKVVERIIGGEVVGTQGTPVELLGGLIRHRFYPELWDIRNELTELAKRDD
jgi:tryptophan 2,3-dioxygenase